MSNRTGEIPSQENVTFIFSLMTSVFCIGGMIGGATTGKKINYYLF